MARGPNPSQVTRMVVWGRAGGRCQFAGCGKRLDGDLVTGDLNKNLAYLAHIVASDPGGVRGHPVLSHQLSDVPENLMLMCDPHHREIDDPQKRLSYTTEVLREMKQRHSYEKPSERKNREKSEAIRRARKLARKKAQREGLLPDPKKKLLEAKKALGQRPGAGGGDRGGMGGGGGPRRSF